MLPQNIKKKSRKKKEEDSIAEQNNYPADSGIGYQV